MDFDVAVVGAGPAGYACALRAAGHGLRVVCIDRRPMAGGVCLFEGCIPSKALLVSSHGYAWLREEGAGHGIVAKDVSLDLAAMMARKHAVVDRLAKGLSGLLRRRKVAFLEGEAELQGGGVLEVKGDGGGVSRRVVARHIVVATGSAAAALPSCPFDGDMVWDSTKALSLERCPRKLVIAGAGYVGLELGSVWRRLGAQVVVVEALERMASGMDAEIATVLRRSLERQGLRFMFGCRVMGVARRSGGGIAVSVEDSGGTRTLEADGVLVAVGRRPVTEGLGLQAAGVSVDERGFIRTGAHFVCADGVYAVGDVRGGALLAHKASCEGEALADHLAGRWGEVVYGLIPAVVYTEPEAASVGESEEALRSVGRVYRKGSFPFTANGRALCEGDGEGFVKLLVCSDSDSVLGAHVVGRGAGVLVAEVAAMMAMGGACEDIARLCHAHPTRSEAWGEAAWSLYEGRSV